MCVGLVKRAGGSRCKVAFKKRGASKSSDDNVSKEVSSSSLFARQICSRPSSRSSKFSFQKHANEPWLIECAVIRVLVSW